MALIHGKTTLLFWDNRRMSPVWQSGVESKLKKIANSTYWEADLMKVGLEGGDGKGCRS